VINAWGSSHKELNESLAINRGRTSSITIA